MAKKEFLYRGKTLPELEEMSTEQFCKLANTKARRKIKRGLDKKFLKKVDAAKAMLKSGKQPKVLRTHHRNMVVIPAMVGLRIAIHTGKEFQITDIMPEMLGHYLGELALSRKRLRHGKAGIGATKSSTAIAARK
jgi:small subunit ribosomal protein S19